MQQLHLKNWPLLFAMATVVSSGALAKSNGDRVALYGILDSYVGSTKVSGDTAAAQKIGNGGLTSSFWGMSGTEVSAAACARFSHWSHTFSCRRGSRAGPRRTRFSPTARMSDYRAHSALLPSDSALVPSTRNSRGSILSEEAVPSTRSFFSRTRLITDERWQEMT